MLSMGNSGQNRRLLSFVLSFLLLYILLTIYLRRICHRDPSSIFWRPEESRPLSYSAFRQAQAHKLADQAEKHELTKWDNTTAPRLCVGIGSVSRHGFSYLRQTLGSVLEGLDEHERRQIYIVVFLAHRDQSQHGNSAAAWLGNMADSLPSYPDDPDLLALIEKLDGDTSYPAHARKQKIDYSVLLAECAKTDPVYTMTLEDDVIALDGWFHRTLSALRTAERKTQEMGKEKFLYLRIFRDGRLMGWNSEEWLQYLGLSALLVLVELAFVLITRCRYPAIRKSTPPRYILLICGVFTPSIICLFFASGRSCMVPRQPGVSLMQKYGCCGQGLVFPQKRIVEDLLSLYGNTTDEHAAVDTFLEDYANENNELRWAVTPVLIQHVGGKSSHGVGDQTNGHFTDDMPFDFDFEMNRPEQLFREHQGWIKQMREPEN